MKRNPAQRPGALIGRGLRKRCPRCGGRPFETFFRMQENCDTCGLHFEREEGFWVGALIVNTTVTFFSFLVVFVGGILVTWPDVPWGVVMAATIAVNVLIPVGFYPISKTLWLALEMTWHPLEPEEIAAAASRAEGAGLQVRDA